MESAQKKFYRDRAGDSKEIKEFFNWMVEQRNKEALPVERIRRVRPDGTKDPEAENMMIYDIEYWLEGGRIMNRKIYMPFPAREPGQEG